MPISTYPSLIYVSASNMELGTEDLEIKRIVEASVVRNREHDLTGSLIYAKGFFAQFLEGPIGPLEDLWQRIQVDERHTDVRLLLRSEAGTRHFAGWSLAYNGRASYLANELQRLHVGGASAEDVDRLIYMLQQFSGRVGT